MPLPDGPISSPNPGDTTRCGASTRAKHDAAPRAKPTRAGCTLDTSTPGGSTWEMLNHFQSALFIRHKLCNDCGRCWGRGWGWGLSSRSGSGLGWRFGLVVYLVVSAGLHGRCQYPPDATTWSMFSCSGWVSLSLLDILLYRRVLQYG